MGFRLRLKGTTEPFLDANRPTPYINQNAHGVRHRFFRIADGHRLLVSPTYFDVGYSMVGLIRGKSKLEKVKVRRFNGPRSESFWLTFSVNRKNPLQKYGISYFSKLGL